LDGDGEPEQQLDRATMVDEADRQGGNVASESDRATLVAAVAEDLATVSATAGRDEERLARVQTQTRVLAEAVIASAMASDDIAPTIRAVTAEM
jgi:hypothetical protein